MDEYQRNKAMYSLVQQVKHDQEVMDLVETFVNKDTESIQHTFKLLTGPSPIAALIGVKDLSELGEKKELTFSVDDLGQFVKRFHNHPITNQEICDQLESFIKLKKAKNELDNLGNNDK